MKEHAFYTIILMFGPFLVFSQTELEISAYNFSVTSEKNGYDIKIIDITEESQKIYNFHTSIFEEFENELIETDKGYTFFNREKIDFYYIGFYKEHSLLWDSYSTKFIMKLPENLKGPCSEVAYTVNMRQVGAAYLGHNKKNTTLEYRKSQAIMYFSNAYENDCKDVSPSDLFNLLDVDVIPLGGAKIKEKTK